MCIKETCNLIYSWVGKNVLIFDLETTGLPVTKKESQQYEKYYDPKMNSYYDHSRIVEIGWCYIEDFSIDKLKTAEVLSIIRKPSDFKIKDVPNVEYAIKLHGITDEKAEKEGVLFTKILNNNGFGEIIKNVDVIIGHNVYFDVSILMNELWRSKYVKLYDKLSKLVNTSNIVDSMCWDLTRPNRYRYTKLCNLHEMFCDFQPKICHTAKDDVISLINIIKVAVDIKIQVPKSSSNIQVSKISSNIPLPKSSSDSDDNSTDNDNSDSLSAKGTRWSCEEEEQLLEELLTTLTIDEIAFKHRRTNGAIKSKTRELAYKMHEEGMSDEEIIEKTKLTEEELLDTILRRKRIKQRKEKIQLQKSNEITTLQNEIKILKTEISSINRNLQLILKKLE